MKKTVFGRAAALVFSAGTALVLLACGGGGSDGSSPSPVATTPETTTPATNPATTPEPATPVATAPSVSDAEVLALADATNIASSGFPWSGRFAGVVKRWTLPIPVKTNGEPRAVPAMDAIEAKLGYVVFDRTSIASADEATITRGLIFRQGTSYLPAGANPQSYCANVARAPFDGGYPSTFMFAPGEISARLYVNLDNPQCTASADIVIHELGHALGMGAHFAGFGDDDAIGAAFWPVLATLYGNPIGTPKGSVVIKQAKN
jgi:hypothetical protein